VKAKNVIILIALISCTAIPILAQSTAASPPSQSQSKGDTGELSQKLRQYVANEMWEEAASELKGRIRTDEFNADLRFLMGEVLLRTGRFNEAIYQLTLSKKFDDHLWQATEALATANIGTWEHGGNLDNRRAACSLYEQLRAAVISRPKELEPDLVSILAPQPDDLDSGHRRALEGLFGLYLPMGGWRDSKGTTYQVISVQNAAHSLRIYRSSQVDGFKNIDTSDFALSTAKDKSFTGEGFKAVGDCVMKVTTTMKTSDCGTKLFVEEIPTGSVVSIEPSHEKACKALVRNLAGNTSMLSLSLTRTSE
jgi:hypothetical protein